jgi:two-component system, cell cycle response regulator
MRALPGFAQDLRVSCSNQSWTQILRHDFSGFSLQCSIFRPFHLMVTMPRTTPSDAAALELTDASVLISSLRLPGVMVVEDEVVVARDIEKTLVGLGYRVIANVRTAQAAIYAMEEARPDLVLSDIRIKGDLDGIELANLARDRFGVPVVFLTSHADEATLARANAAHPYGYVLKPFRARELRAGLELALRKHALDTHLGQQALTDELTGLYNRRGFLVLAEQQLKVAARAGRSAMLVFAALNDLKDVDERLGQVASDDLLLDAARALHSTFRESDILARLSEDKFAVLALEPQPGAAEVLQSRLEETIQRLNAEAGRLHPLSVSVCVRAWDPELQPSIQDLLTQAEAQVAGVRVRHRQLAGGMFPARFHDGTRSAPASRREPEPRQIVALLKRALTLRQPALGEHAEAVAGYSRALAEHLGYSDEAAAALAEAALLCDIGKLFVPDAALRDSPSPSHRDQLKEHTKLGARLLNEHGLQNPEGTLLQRAAVIALRHHERWDGTGYPDGLRDHEIPLDARVVAVANALARMTPEMRQDGSAVLRHFVKLAGSEFDPLVVDALERALAEPPNSQLEWRRHSDDC